MNNARITHLPATPTPGRRSQPGPKTRVALLFLRLRARRQREQAALARELAEGLAANADTDETLANLLLEALDEPPERSAVGRLAYTLDEVAEALAMGRTKVRELADGGAFGPLLRIGTSVRVPATALTGWIASQTTEEGGDGDYRERAPSGAPQPHKEKAGSR